MKNTIIITLVTSILGFSIFNAWTDSTEFDEHHIFFDEQKQFSKKVTQFMDDTNSFKAKGERNTSSMGMALCERLNVIEMIESLQLTNCKRIYRQGISE